MTKRPEGSTKTTGVRATESPAAIFESARKQGGGDGGAGSPESAASLTTVVDLVRRITRADAAGIATVSPAGDTMTWSAASGFAEGFRPSFHLSAELARRIIAGGGVIVLENVRDEIPAGESSMLGGEGVRDVALAPLDARGETLGILGVGYRTAHQFSADEKQTIEDLARMAALALDNARLFETVVTAKKVWEQTFDAIPDGVIVHDDQLRIARCNAEAAAMMGFDHPAEVIGETCAKVFARLFGERAAAYYMRQSTATGAASSFELQAEGGRRYLVAVAPIKGLGLGVVSPESLEPNASAAHISTARNSGSQISDFQPPASGLRPPSWSVITWSDVTELAEIQEQLARARRLATVGQLAAGVAHEINNPLAAITTCAESCLRDIRNAPEAAIIAEGRDWYFYLEEIVRQSLRCKAITRGLLDLTRQRRALSEMCDLNSAVERCFRLFEGRGRETSATFTLNLGDGV
ncbi:MAG TPA: GAF domain-containing protein, partial [Pyrinomonadaceae bacterium]|nr:GAF domain-containing protein [Pyrinomonadaceae bacterium]